MSLLGEQRTTERSWPNGGRSNGLEAADCKGRQIADAERQCDAGGGHLSAALLTPGTIADTSPYWAANVPEARWQRVCAECSMVTTRDRCGRVHDAICQEHLIGLRGSSRLHG